MSRLYISSQYVSCEQKKTKLSLLLTLQLFYPKIKSDKANKSLYNHEKGENKFKLMCFVMIIDYFLFQPVDSANNKKMKNVNTSLRSLGSDSAI